MFDLKKFPERPGVYIMKDPRGRVLYVGKAKNIRARLNQYFSGHDDRPQIPALLKKVTKIDTLVVSSEKEALLLENNLIKKHKPPYNVFLKDDKGYISLKITKHKWPMIQLVRYKGKTPSDGHYFGPYTSTYAARETLELLIRLFPLRRCSDRELMNRTRPCILHGMKRCVAPCVDKCTKDEYDAIVQKTIRFLQGKDKQVVKDLYKEMEVASEALEFERAADIHRTIQYIERTVEQQRVDQAGSGDRDVIGIYREAGEVSLSQLLFREGKLLGAENYHFSSVAQETPHLLTSFLMQHYDEKELPHEIILPSPVDEAKTLAEILSLDKKRRAQILSPKRGNKLALVQMASENAQAAFHKERDLKTMREKTLLSLQERLRLNNYPHRIECFDNSNLHTTEPVAVMVAYLDGEKEKARYRKYKLKKLDKPDDYAAMYEALSRRLKKGDLPDLIIVDGGKGHLNVAMRALIDQNIISVDVIGVAKEKSQHTKGETREQVFLPNVKDPIMLRPNSQMLFLLQRIRDEAHRFAITFHRKRRAKALLHSPLDNVPGIGPAKKKALLRHFGSAKKALAATPEELAQVKGISLRDAQIISELNFS